MITFTITISHFVAALLVIFAVLILLGLIWLIAFVYSISNDRINLSYIDDKLSEILNHFDSKTKK